jgi:hypothetical protein
MRPVANRSPGHYEATPGTGVVHDVIEADPWAFEPGVVRRERSVKLVPPWRRRLKTSVRLVAGNPPETAFAGWIVEVEVDPEPTQP